MSSLTSCTMCTSHFLIIGFFSCVLLSSHDHTILHDDIHPITNKIQNQAKMGRFFHNWPYSLKLPKKMCIKFIIPFFPMHQMTNIRTRSCHEI